MATSNYRWWDFPVAHTIRKCSYPSENTKEKTDRAVREWVKTNLTYPCTQMGRSHFDLLRLRVHKATEGITVPDEAIVESLERVRDREWPEMVYQAGLVPIYHQPTGTVWARPPEQVPVYVKEGEEGNVNKVIPRNGSVIEMGRPKKKKTQKKKKDVRATNPASIPPHHIDHRYLTRAAWFFSKTSNR